jgi:hypothetical protein
VTDRNDRPLKGAHRQTVKPLKLEMPWDGWFDLSPEECAREESVFLDYMETVLSEERFPGFVAMFESRYKDAIRAWHEKKRRRRSRGS